MTGRYTRQRRYPLACRSSFSKIATKNGTAKPKSSARRVNSSVFRQAVQNVGSLKMRR